MEKKKIFLKGFFVVAMMIVPPLSCGGRQVQIYIISFSAEAFSVCNLLCTEIFFKIIHSNKKKKAMSHHVHTL